MINCRLQFMASQFESSPRATKRRRTATYNDERTISGRNNLSSTGNSTGASRATAADSAEDDGQRMNVTPSKPGRGILNGSCYSERQADQPNENAADLVAENLVQSTLRDVHVQDDNEAEEETPQPRSSGRQRRPPRRLVEAAQEDLPAKRTRKAVVNAAREEAVPSRARTSAPGSPTLKGILTPSRKQKGGPRKSVMFNQDEKEVGEQLGFRDVGTPSAKRPTRKLTPHPSKSKGVELNDVPDDPDAVDNAGVDGWGGIPAAGDMLLIDEPRATIPVPKSLTSDQLPSPMLGNDPSALQTVRHLVLERLSSSCLPIRTPAHLESQFTQLHSLLNATVEASESNSLLLLGPRGAGKTLLLDLTLRELSATHHNAFHTVRLNGFMQTDDRIALREIWRQLGHSRELDESETEEIGASYADTMASLLSLLSHPDEMVVDGMNTNGPQTTTKSIVFILDEFDLFTTHPRQTLLYNLFDIAQSRKAPIAVVGCSSRMDVIECLEKRVKSRFSHRWLLVPSCKSIAEWEEEVQRALLIDDEASQRASKQEQAWMAQWNACVKDKLLSRDEAQRLVRLYFYTTKSLPDLFMALLPIVATLRLDDAVSANPQTVASRLRLSAEEVHSFHPPAIPSVLPSLPVLHLSLLVSMCRLETIHTLAISNFNLVFTHYTELIQSSRLKQTAHGSVTHSGTLRQWSREICREAWEELSSGAIIVPVVGGRDEDGGLTGGAETEDTRSWRSEVTLGDVLWSVKEKFSDDTVGGGAGEVLTRWCKEM